MQKIDHEQLKRRTLAAGYMAAGGRVPCELQDKIFTALSTPTAQLRPDRREKVEHVERKFADYLKLYPLGPKETSDIRIIDHLPICSLECKINKDDRSEKHFHITLGATLIDQLTKEELLAIVSHEWGHKLAGQFEDDGHTAEFTADATAVMLTRDPKALISALHASKNLVVDLGFDKFEARAEDKTTDSHPSTEARVDNIKTVARGMGLWPSTERTNDTTAHF